MSYSQDFKMLVVNKIHGGMSRSEAMEFFNISRDSVYRWLKIFKEKGDFSSPAPKARKPRKIDPALLIAAFEKRPDATLAEIAEEFDCWPQSIHKRCVKLGITRKKNHVIRRTKRRKKAGVFGGD